MRIRHFQWFAVALTLLPHAAAQQAYLNLDFETTTRGRLWSWTNSGSGYEFAVDPSTAVSGAQSYRIRNMDPSRSGSSVYQYLPVEVVRGKRLHFAGYMKTDGITQGGAGLWVRVDGPSGSLSGDNDPFNVTNGTTGWQQYVIDHDVSPLATNVIVGGFQFGNGTAWFDNFAIDVEGVPFPQSAAPLIGEPTASQLDWMQQTANPFWTPDAENGLDDLWPVKSMVGNSRIVGLGEGTHGTSEFFRMKHRLLEYLATEMGFTIFSIEATMPEAYRLNDYVLNGRGDPKELLKGMGYWTWNTQEVLDMVQWMRRFNFSGKGPVQFTGFDMQIGTAAAANVLSFVGQAEPSYAPTVAAAFALAANVQNNNQRNIAQSEAAVQAAVAAVHAVWQYLTDRRTNYLANFSASSIDWAIQNTRVMEQATYLALGGGPYRDRSMAENIDWILQQNPGARIVLWAHDYHVSRASGSMGSYLAANHGKDYTVFGQLLHSGAYNAYSSLGILGENSAAVSFPGSVEYVLHSTGMPQFFLDIRRASAADPGSAWLVGDTQYRYIGATAGDGFQVTHQLTKDYDVLIFFDRTTASTLLPLN